MALDIPTRGKTHPNRLRRVDLLISLFCEELIASDDFLFVDLGFGWNCYTTLDSFRFFTHNPLFASTTVRCLGVELDKDRVNRAKAYATRVLDAKERKMIKFRKGGSELPLDHKSSNTGWESPSVIRCCNVFRQAYSEKDAGEIVSKLVKRLKPGGILIEGTSNPLGRFMILNIVRHTREGGQLLEAVVFSTNFKEEIVCPSVFQSLLPKNLIHHMHDSNFPKLDSFLRDWILCFKLARNMLRAEVSDEYPVSERAILYKSVELLGTNFDHEVLLSPSLLKKGFVVWDWRKFGAPYLISDNQMDFSNAPGAKMKHKFCSK